MRRSAADAAVGVAGAIGEGPKEMKPSLVEILHALTGTKGWAQFFAQSHPEHGEAVDKFIEDLNQITRELQNSIYGESEF